VSLDRFETAQADCIDTVMAELARGRKDSHWMWFIFPQPVSYTHLTLPTICSV